MNIDGQKKDILGSLQDIQPDKILLEILRKKDKKKKPDEKDIGNSGSDRE